MTVEISIQRHYSELHLVPGFIDRMNGQFTSEQLAELQRNLFNVGAGNTLEMQIPARKLLHELSIVDEPVVPKSLIHGVFLELRDFASQDPMKNPFGVQYATTWLSHVLYRHINEGSNEAFGWMAEFVERMDSYLGVFKRAAVREIIDEKIDLPGYFARLSS